MMYADEDEHFGQTHTVYGGTEPLSDSNVCSAPLKPPVKRLMVECVNDLPNFIIESFSDWTINRYNASNGKVVFDWYAGWIDLTITKPGHLRLGFVLKWKIMRALKQANRMQVVSQMNSVC